METIGRRNVSNNEWRQFGRQMNTKGVQEEKKDDDEEDEEEEQEEQEGEKTRLRKDQIEKRQD